MARHHNYSKRSRESLKAMTDGTADEDGDDRDYPEPGECIAEEEQPLADGAGLPPDPVH